MTSAKRPKVKDLRDGRPADDPDVLRVGRAQLVFDADCDAWTYDGPGVTLDVESADGEAVGWKGVASLPGFHVETSWCSRPEEAARQLHDRVIQLKRDVAAAMREVIT